MVAVSETVAFSSFLANSDTFFRRCRRRLISFRRSLHGTFLTPRFAIIAAGEDEEPPYRR